MEAYVKNDLNKTYLILEGKESGQEDYQTIMLRENEIPRILKTDVRNLDNQSYYYYDISGKTALQTLYEKSHMNYEEMKRLIEDLLMAIDSLEKYMLDGNEILLNPEFIFWDRKQYSFCYFPFHQANAKDAFHQLMEFLVLKVDERDEEGVRFAYTFHKATMDAHYSIAEIMQRFEPSIVDTKEKFSDIVGDFQTEEMEEELEAEEETSLWSRIQTFLKDFLLHQDEDDL